jgi:HAD superfamily hydrolase (TIGR01509 family)
MIKLIIFDLDGVLVDSKDIHYHALNKALEELAPEFVISYSDHLANYDGLSTKKKLKLLEYKGLSNQLHDRIERSKQIFTQTYIQDIQPDIDKQLIFRELRNKGFKIAVASNAIYGTVYGMLDRLGLKRYINQSYCNFDVKRPKPSAEIYMKACMDFQVDPPEALVLEDSPIGRQAALSAGCHLLPVENAFSWNIQSVLKAIDKANGIRPMIWTDEKLNVVIPMAGLGSRFEKAGYTFPKPLIEVCGKPMIQVVTENLGIKAEFTFVVQRSHFSKYNLHTMLNLISPNCNIVAIDEVTDGAACTVLKAKEFFNNERPLLIANSDQFLEWDPSDFYYTATNATLDGLMVTFKATHPKWSFAKFDNTAHITEVAEKNPISDNATAGIYYWRRGSDFFRHATNMIDANDRINGEFYVAPVHNYGIKAGLKFRPYIIEKLWGLGTPEDLNAFLENYKGII